MSALKSIPLVIGLSALYGTLIFVSGALAGAGHGSDYFGAILLAPFSAFSDSLWVLLAGVSLWVLVPILIAMRRFVGCRIAAAAVLAAHYIGVLMVSLKREDWDYIASTWRHGWILIVFLAGVYFASQGFMWRMITRNRYGA